MSLTTAAVIVVGVLAVVWIYKSAHRARRDDHFRRMISERGLSNEYHQWLTSIPNDFRMKALKGPGLAQAYINWKELQEQSRK